MTDWANRWLGGFCAVGALGGQPVRGPDYTAHPPCSELLPLSADADADADGTLEQAEQAWADLLGVAVALFDTGGDARRAINRALAGASGARVQLPANATRDLAESIKQIGMVPHFCDLDSAGRVQARERGLLTWTQPFGGASPAEADADRVAVDAADSLPIPGMRAGSGQVLLAGLHIGGPQGGALVASHDTALIAHLRQIHRPVQLNAARAYQQAQRLPELAAAQQQAVATVANGLDAAAGLPILGRCAGVLPWGVMVRCPEPCEPATFYGYVLGEQTPVVWVPAERPLHYAAFRAGGAPDAAVTAAELARWMLIPVGPGYTEEERTHAILGPTKAADHLGVRWSNQPERAAWYASLMDEWYGPGHDAFRPLAGMLAVG